MSTPFRINCIPNDWPNLERQLNKLTRWVVSQPLTSHSSPHFAGLTIDSLSGIIKGVSGVIGLATGGTDYEYPLTFGTSLTRSTNAVALTNDSAAPGNNYFYGTGPTGVKGFFTISSGIGGTGNLTESTSSILTIGSGTGAVVGSGTTIQVKQAATGQSGYLSSTDWNTFNSKQATLAKSIAGTSNQVNVSSNSNSVAQDITLSLPQNIHSGASPVFAGLTLDTNTLYIDSTNHRIGSGTLTPSYGFHLQKSANNFSEAAFVVENTNAGALAGVQNFIKNNAGAWIQNAVYGSGYTGTVYGLTRANLAEMTANVRAVYGSTSAFAASFITSSLVRMTIDSTGLVGIGITPTAQIHVYKTDGSYVSKFEDGGINCFNAFISTAGRGEYGIYGDALYFQALDTLANGIRFYPSNSGSIYVQFQPNSVTFVSNTNVDFTLNFTGTTNSGILTWMEDEDYFKFSDDVMLVGGENIVLDTVTGTKIGTATNQLLGFYNATPVDQPGNAEDIKDALVSIGLLSNGGATPLNLDGGALTVGSANIGSLSGLLLGTAGAVSAITNNSSNWDNAYSKTNNLGIFNPYDYGATGNGTTDDTATVQATYDAVPVGGGTVIIPKGTFLVDGILIKRDRTITIGFGGKLLGSKKNIHIINTNNYDYVEFRGLSVEGTGKDDGGSSSGRGAIHIETESEHCKIIGCSINKANGTGITDDGWGYSEIIGNDINETGEHGIYLSSPVHTVCQGNVITDVGKNCALTNTSAYGIKIDGATYCSVNGNTITNSLTQGIQFAAEATGNTVIGNTVYMDNSTGKEGISVSGGMSKENVVDGNIVYQTRNYYCIEATSNSKGTTIVNNICKLSSAATSGMGIFAGGVNTLVANNKVITDADTTPGGTNGYGIWVGNDNCTVTNNEVYVNGSGLWRFGVVLANGVTNPRIINNRIDAVDKYWTGTGVTGVTLIDSVSQVGMDIGEGGVYLTQVLGSQDTWNPGSIAIGAEEIKTVAVTGVTLGDIVIASFSLDVAGLLLTANVTATDVVTCVLSNPTVGAVDLGSGTIKVRVFKW